MRWMPLVLIAVGCDPSSADKPQSDDGAGEDTAFESVVYEDRDRDGVLAADDCDDLDHRVFPGADEICDGKDNDCNGQTDEGFDLDGDGAWNMADCAHGTDCDDSDPEVPKDERPYDGIDQDCDGTDLIDVDRDGYAGRSGGGNDCDDFDETIYPGAAEVAVDGIDQNCDGVDLLDSDGDGFDAAEFGGDDCDDGDESIFPGALDWASDGIDADCDGEDGGLFDVGDVPVSIVGTFGKHELLGHDIVICDLDSDELDDIVVTAPYAGDFQGAVAVFYGRNSADWSRGMSMDQASTYILSTGTGWGFGVDCADVNGDGRDDLIIGQAEIQFGPYVSDYAVNVIYGVGGMLPGLLDDRDADATFSVDLGAPGGVGELQGGKLVATDLTGDDAAEIILDQNVGNTAYGQSAIWVIAGADYRGTYALDELVYAEIADPQGDTVTALTTDGQHFIVGQGHYRPSLSDADDAADFPEGGKVSVVGLLAGEFDSVSSAADLEVSLPTEAQLGASVDVGDYDGDGATDLAMGAPLFDGSGTVFVVSGYKDLIGDDAEGAGLDLVGAAEIQIVGSQGGLGSGLAIVDDVTGDGVADFLVAESEVDSVGAVWVVSGALLEAGTNAVEDVSLLGLRAQYHVERIGENMGAGDFDGDGVADLVVGSSHHPTPADVGLTMSGRVSILLSSER